MALKGEGDKRWVVRDRTDGRNVNGWHWEDKDVTKWAEERLKQLISSETCSSDMPSPGVHAVSLDNVDGDATLYNRKGILKVLYDLKLSGKWCSLHETETNPIIVGDVKEEKEKMKIEDEKDKEKNSVPNGEFKIDLFDDDPEIIATVDNKCTADNASKYRSAFLSKVGPKIVEKCQIFIHELHEGADQFIDGLSIPKEKSGMKTIGRSITKSRTEVSSTKKVSSSSSSSSEKGTTEIVMTEGFTCRASDWILALTDGPRLSAITRSKAIVEAKTGGKWDVMNGTATGKIVSLVLGKEVVMTWRLKSWGSKDDVADGLVIVNVDDKEGRTKVTIKVKDVPKGKESETEGFWRIQILQAMRFVMGWGDASKFANM